VTLAEAEREHIVKALEESNWLIGGVRGAAARLGLKRTTLIDKMRRHGLSREAAYGDVRRNQPAGLARSE
jgi:formate hydrogenlyase transcriptional activator